MVLSLVFNIYFPFPLLLALPPVTTIRSNNGLVHRASVNTPVIDAKVPRSQEIQATVVQFIDEKGEIFCSGYFVDSKTLGTAKHCLEGKNIKSLKASVYTPGGGPGSVDTRRTIPLCDEKSDGQVDFSVIKLCEEVPETKGFPRLSMASGPCDPNSEYKTAGFGMTEKGHPSQQLRLAEYGIGEKDGDGLRIIPKGAGKACEGDSGGPVLCQEKGNWVIAGMFYAMEGNKLNSEFFWSKRFQDKIKENESVEYFKAEGPEEPWQKRKREDRNYLRALTITTCQVSEYSLMLPWHGQLSTRSTELISKLHDAASVEQNTQHRGRF